MKGAWLLLLSLAAAALPAAAQPAAVRNASVETRTAGAGLERVVRELMGGMEGAWIGYAVPADGRHRSCCGHWNGPGCCGVCRLETGSTSNNLIHRDALPRDPVRLEGPSRAHVLLRVAARRIESVRTFSEDCALDFGGRSLVWLESVSAAESVDLLASLVDAHEDEALAAIALHGGPNDAAVERRAVETLVRLARGHGEGELRGQALFWLSQKASRRSADAITEAIERDPETEVKKAAVFALSQLPPDEGVPLLIRTARANRNPAVREQALFWLGQSEDDRALAFFEEILRR
jgi:hypothetical protein